jgi:hypothetical protein
MAQIKNKKKTEGLNASWWVKKLKAGHIYGELRTCRNEVYLWTVFELADKFTHKPSFPPTIFLHSSPQTFPMSIKILENKIFRGFIAQIPVIVALCLQIAVLAIPSIHISEFDLGGLNNVSVETLHGVTNISVSLAVFS